MYVYRVVMLDNTCVEVYADSDEAAIRQVEFDSEVVVLYAECTS